MKQIQLIVMGMILLFASTANGQLYTQGFNGGTIPAGWASVVTNDIGVNPALTFVTTSVNPTGLGPCEGTHFVRFNSYNCPATSSIRLYQTVPFATTGGISGVNVNFAWARSNSNPTKDDRVVVQYSLDGASWTDVNSYSRVGTGTIDWQTVTCALPAGAINQPNVFIAFHFISAYGGDCHLDSLVVTSILSPALLVSPGTLDLGYTAQGGTSAEKSFNLTGFNLVGFPGDITVTAPAGFRVSLTSGSGFASSIAVPYNAASLPSTTIYVIFEPVTAHTNYSGNINISGSGDSKTVAVTGTSWPIYCVSSATSINDEEIYKVRLGSINNSSTCSSTGGSGSILNRYSNYRALPAADLYSQVYYSFTIEVGSCGTMRYGNAVKMFIDYNMDLDFDDADELVYVSPDTIAGAHTESGYIQIPATAASGLTMMRVINVEVLTPDSIHSCGIYSYGETEDYTINIMPAPSCLPPYLPVASNFTLNSVQLGWIETGTAISWQIEYGQEGFIPGSGNQVVVGTNPYTLNGLAHSTRYNFRVRSICAPGDTSMWSDFLDIETLCDIHALPYAENFDAITLPNLPVCYTITNNNTDTQQWHTDVLNAHSAPNCLLIQYNDSLAMDDWFFTPSFTFEAGKYYKVDFYYANDGSLSYTERMAVNWGLAPNAASMTGGNIFQDESIQGATAHGSGIIHPSVTGVYYVGFHGYSDTNMSSLMVDDIGIREVPFSDVTILQSDVHECDTLGWMNPPITFNNVGDDIIPTGDSITASYVLNGGSPVFEKFIVSSQINPGSSASFFFTTMVHLNAFTTYNVTYALEYLNDFNILNDTTHFTVNIHGFPSVSLGNDTMVCGDASVTLSANTSGVDYLWWDNSVSSTHVVDSSLCSGLGTCDFFVEVTDGFGCSNTDTISVTWSSCTSIAEGKAMHTTIMPNPSNGVFSIDFGGLTGETYVEITDLSGKVVMAETITLTGFEKEQYDLSAYGKGIYNVRIANSNDVAVRRIVVN